MNSKNIIAIKDEKIRCTCMKCLKEHDESHLHYIHIPQMGYGSGFDGFDTLLILCDECYKDSIKDNKDLWNMREKAYTVHYKRNDNLTPEEKKKQEESIVEYVAKDDTTVPIDMMNGVTITCDHDESFYEYEHEKEMFDFIHNLPIPGQELIYNRLDKGIFSHGGHDPQDYIDYELGELSYEKCKKNHWVSPDEIKSYHENYEKCDHVIDITYEDGSGGSRCLLYPTVSGKHDGKCSNKSYGCYQCKFFKERKGEIRKVLNKKCENAGAGISDSIDVLEIKEKMESGFNPKKE